MFRNHPEDEQRSVEGYFNTRSDEKPQRVEENRLIAGPKAALLMEHLVFHHERQYSSSIGCFVYITHGEKQ